MNNPERGLPQGYDNDVMNAVNNQNQTQWDELTDMSVDNKAQATAETEKQVDREGAKNILKPIVTKVLIIALSAGVAFTAPKVVEKVKDHDDKVMEQVQNTVDQVNAEKAIYIDGEAK